MKKNEIGGFRQGAVGIFWRCDDNFYKKET